MRFFTPFLLILPLVLSSKASELKQCTEYNEAKPIASWSSPVKTLAPLGFTKGMQYERLITVSHRKKNWWTKRVTWDAYQYDMSIDFTNHASTIISANLRGKEGVSQKWKFNLEDPKGRILHSYWLDTNDLCSIPSSQTNEIIGSVSVQYAL